MVLASKEESISDSESEEKSESEEEKSESEEESELDASECGENMLMFISSETVELSTKPQTPMEA